MKERILQHSHIIPEFFYKDNYDHKHRFIVFQKDRFKKTDIEQYKKVEQKGYRQYLLCKKCEGIFGKNETYFSNLYQGDFHQLHINEKSFTPNDKYKIISGFDYHKTSHFFLSLVWRTIVSNIPITSQCGKIELEEEMRYVLCNNLNVSNKRFGISIIFIENYLRIMYQPFLEQINNSLYRWRFCCNKYLFHVYITKNNETFSQHTKYEIMNGEGNLISFSLNASDLPEYKLLPELIKDKKKEDFII